MKTTESINQEIFRAFVKKELDSRKARNKSYSLRAFSTSLEIDPSYLSKFLRGKKDISYSKFQKIISILKIGPKKVKRLTYPVIFNEKEKKLRHEKAQLTDFSREKLLIISAVNEPNKEVDLSYLVKITKLPKKKILHHLAELSEQGLFKKTKNGSYSKRSKRLSTSGQDIKLTEVKKEMFEDVLKVVSTYEKDLFYSNAGFILTSEKKVKEARELMSQFGRKLLMFLERTNKKDSLYYFNSDLIPAASKKKDN